MSLQGTFSTATHALNAQSQHLSNIATNIANVQTNAYKVQQTSFQTLLTRVTSMGDRFLGAESVDTRQVDRQGLILSTQRQLDLAIEGRGLFVTNVLPDGSGDWQFTRDGGFVGRATEFETDSDGDGVNDQGAVLTTTGGNTVFGWPANEDGTFDEFNDLNSLEPVTINSNQVFPSRPTSNIVLQANLSAEDLGRQSVGLPFIDATGTSRTVTVGFTATPTNEFTLDASSLSVNNQPVSVTFQPATVDFTGFGTLASPANGFITLTVNDATGPQTMTLDISQITQFQSTGDLEVINLEQDGLTEGLLRNTFFDTDGVLYGSFTNAGLVPLFKLPLATFPAQNNLEAANGNVFKATEAAGVMELRGMGSVNGLAQVIVGALEQSNVDLADQFTKMIVTQRAYSSSATVLRTADEMTQQARDLKR